MTSAHRRFSRKAAGFTLFELLLVVLILGIAAAIFTPAVGDNLRSARLRTSANVLAADIEFCASECITRPATPRAILFDLTNNKYSVIDLGTSAVIPYPGDSQPYTNDFNTGRYSQLGGVTLTSVLAGSTTATLLTFDQYGKPLITSPLTITLQYKNSLMTVSVATVTGDISIADAGQASSSGSSGSSDSSGSGDSSGSDDSGKNDNGNNTDNGNGNKNGVDNNPNK